MNDRISYTKMEYRWFNVVLINGYAPTENKEEEVRNIFNEGLDTVCDLIPINTMNKVLIENTDYA